MGWFRSALAVLVLVVGAATVMFVGPAGAADGDPVVPGTGIETEETAAGSVELVRDDDSSGNIIRPCCRRTPP